ncbi:hypothetical protein EON81_09915 [bacterium]|nr:MAG: hypothetical protein EON81_09915 [bacterium]
MRQIRSDIWEVNDDDLGRPEEAGVYEVSGLGDVHLDIADLRYVAENRGQGFKPTFFVRRSPALGGRFVVTSRQRAA